MKLAFSTLGCPDWSVAEMAEKGRQYGFDAIDFRGVQRTMDLWQVPEFGPGQIGTTLKLITSRGLHVCGISTSARLYAPENAEAWRGSFDEARRSIDLARALDASYVRIFVGQLLDESERGCAKPKIIEHYKRLCEYAETRSILCLIETHDDWCKSEEVREIIDSVNHPLAGVVWDILHPLRLAGESFAHTVDVLADRIKLVHIKDFHKDQGYSYASIGTGDFSPAELLSQLKDMGYRGYLVLELPKLHRPELPEPEETFPRFVEMIKPYIT